LELRDNQVIISFEILNSSSKDLYRVWIEVVDDNDRVLSARSLRGDIGENIRGGGVKQIAWDYEQDVISVDAGIYVQVFGELMNATTREPQTQEKEEAEKNYSESGPAPSKSGSSVSKSGALFRSVVIPGWGLSAMNPGKPHWLKGIVGYSAIGAAVTFNRMAHSSYALYLESSDQNEITGLYDQAVSQQKISNISAYVAAGIWITDIVWTLVSNPGPGRYTHMNQKGFRLGTGFEPSSQAPMVALRYTF